MKAALMADDRSDRDVIFRDCGRDDWVAAVNADMLPPIFLTNPPAVCMIERNCGCIVNIDPTSILNPPDWRLLDFNKSKLNRNLVISKSKTYQIYKKEDPTRLITTGWDLYPLLVNGG